MNVGLIGFGAINQDIYKYFLRNNNFNVNFKKILVRNFKNYVKHDLSIITDSPEDFLNENLDYVIECAGHESVFSFGERVLKNKSNLMITSTGALTDDNLLNKLLLLSKKYNKKIIIPSAGIGAIDILSASSIGVLKEVNIVIRKNAEAWEGTIAEHQYDLKTYNNNLVLFSGTVREGAKLYPQNVNISATVALAGIGLDKTHLKIISDSSIETHVISINVKGDFGEFSFEENVIPSHENQKTGKIVSLAIIKTLKNLNSNLVIGL